jgi:hypothetical protein
VRTTPPTHSSIHTPGDVHKHMGSTTHKPGVLAAGASSAGPADLATPHAPNTVPRLSKQTDDPIIREAHNQHPTSTVAGTLASTHISGGGDTHTHTRRTYSPCADLQQGCQDCPSHHRSVHGRLHRLNLIPCCCGCWLHQKRQGRVLPTMCDQGSVSMAGCVGQHTATPPSCTAARSGMWHAP